MATLEGEQMKIAEETHETPRDTRDPRPPSHRCYLLQENPRVVIEITGFDKESVDAIKTQIMEKLQ